MGPDEVRNAGPRAPAAAHAAAVGGVGAAADDGSAVAGGPSLGHCGTLLVALTHNKAAYENMGRRRLRLWK